MVGLSPFDPIPPAPPGGRILVVDDEGEVRELLTECLSALGYRVSAVADAEEALEALGRGDDFALMITDLQLSRGSGLALAARVREGWPEVRLLLMSGYFVPLGLPGTVLKKPFSLDDLARAVRTALG